MIRNVFLTKQSEVYNQISICEYVIKGDQPVKGKGYKKINPLEQKLQSDLKAKKFKQK